MTTGRCTTWPRRSGSTRWPAHCSTRSTAAAIYRALYWNVLQGDSDVQAIYGENEEMALGASQAIQALGLKPWDGKDGIITIGADGLKSGYESIKAGQLTATVEVGPVDQGRQSIETIFWNPLN